MIQRSNYIIIMSKMWRSNVNRINIVKKLAEIGRIKTQLIVSRKELKFIFIYSKNPCRLHIRHQSAFFYESRSYPSCSYYSQFNHMKFL